MSRMQKFKASLTSVAVLSVFFSGAAYADLVGFHAGISSWKQVWSGTMATAELGKNLELDDDNSTGIYLAAELPIPLLPNLKVQHTPFKTTGLVQRSFVYDGTPTSVGAQSELEFHQQDVILYNEFLDNWISLDVGIAVRRFDAELFIENGATDINDSASAVVPMLYGATRFDLPFSGFYGMAEMLSLSVGDSGLQDLKAALGYETKVGFGTQLGYRESRMELDDVENFTTDLSVDGAFLALTYSL